MLQVNSIEEPIYGIAIDPRTTNTEQRIRPINYSIIQCFHLMVLCAYQAVEDLGNRRDGSLSLPIDFFPQLSQSLIS